MWRDPAERVLENAATAAVPAALVDVATAAPAPDHSTPCTWVALRKDRRGAHLPVIVVVAEYTDCLAATKAGGRADHQAAADCNSWARRADLVHVMQNPFAVRTQSRAALPQGRGVGSDNFGCVAVSPAE